MRFCSLYALPFLLACVHAHAQNITPSSGPVTPLNSGSITNPTAAVLTLPTRTVVAPSTAVTAATPCVFTWTANPLVNGQTVTLTAATMPGTGQFVAGTVYYVVVQATNTYELAATYGGAALACPTTAGVTVVATIVYAPGTLAASSTGASPTVPSFSIATSAGGAVIPRIRVETNIAGTLSAGSYVGSGWNLVSLSINCWDAAPTYTNGDGQPYAPLTGYAHWIGTYAVTLTQFGDGASGGAGLSGANLLSEKLAAGTAIYCDTQVQSRAYPASGQTITIIPELLN